MSINHHRLETLRSQIRALESHNITGRGCGVLPFADSRLNAPLPMGGLQLGALHEICAEGPENEMASAMTAFAAMLAALILRGRDGAILWAASQTDCYMPGFIRLGLDPARIICADCAKDSVVLSVMEEALHSRALAVVIGEAGSLSLKTGRRLDAAARQSGMAALLLRRFRSKPSKVTEAPSGAAATRWRVSSLPSHPLANKTYFHGHPGNAKGVVRDWINTELIPLCDPGYRQAGSGMTKVPEAEPGLGPPRWRLGLEYCRNGRTASWIVEACDDANGDRGQACHVRVVAELRDDAGALERAPARQALRTVRLA